MIDIDLFAGPGGIDEGRRLASHDDVPVLGVEWEPWACRTAAAAGHPRVRADVSTFPTAHLRGRIRVLGGAPPCPTFSTAGKGAGRLALDLFVSAIGPMLSGHDVRRWVREQHERVLLDAFYQAGGDGDIGRVVDQAADAVLVLEPARWIAETEPEAVLLEQVPAVLPIWQALARELRSRGWSAWAGILNAADYGVPQTRRRAIFIASRARAVGPPPATHDEHPVEDLFGAELQRWISMAAALGWGATGRPVATITSGGTKTGGAEPIGHRDRETLAAERDAGRWVVRTGTNSMVTGRTLDDMQPYRRSIERPAPTLRCNTDRWVVERPATTIAGDARVWPPGHRVNGDDRRRLGTEADERYGDRAGTEAIRITPAEAATLQGFPDGYPWQGNRTRVFEQIGNAVPPPLAAACWVAVLGEAGAG